MAGDPVGFTGPGDPDRLDVEKVLVLMDYLPQAGREGLYGDCWDLVVLHHPPVREPEVPCYVIHSNWDIVDGGACDALADCLDVATEGVLDEKTGLGRVGTIRGGPVPLVRFARETMVKLGVPDLRIVNFRRDRPVRKIALVSGFGLNPDLVRAARAQGVDLYLSGDLSHKSAVLARHLGLVLLDAPHHATEVPGLYRLGERIRQMGLRVQVRNTGVPWSVVPLDGHF